VLLDQVGRLGVDQRVDDVVQGLAHDLVHRGDVPAGAQRRDLRAEALHLLRVGTLQREDELRVGRLEDGAAVDQPTVEERSSEGQGAGLGEDRLVEVEERRSARHGSRL
jgi:hypothetical protein